MTGSDARGRRRATPPPRVSATAPELRRGSRGRSALGRRRRHGFAGDECLDPVHVVGPIGLVVAECLDTREVLESPAGRVLQRLVHAEVVRVAVHEDDRLLEGDRQVAQLGQDGLVPVRRPVGLGERLRVTQRRPSTVALVKPGVGLPDDHDAGRVLAPSPRRTSPAAIGGRLRSGPRTRAGRRPGRARRCHSNRGCCTSPWTSSVAKVTLWNVQRRFSTHGVGKYGPAVEPGVVLVVPTHCGVDWTSACIVFSPNDRSVEKRTSALVLQPLELVVGAVGGAIAVRPVVVARREERRLLERVEVPERLRVKGVATGRGRRRAGCPAPGLQVAVMNRERDVRVVHVRDQIRYTGLRLHIGVGKVSPQPDAELECLFVGRAVAADRDSCGECSGHDHSQGDPAEPMHLLRLP